MVPHLLSELKRFSATAPKSVVLMLGALKDPSAIEALVGELETTRVPRSIVLAALTDIAHPDAVVPLLSLLAPAKSEGNEEVYQTLRSCLTSSSPGADVLAGNLDWESPQNQSLILDLLYKIQDPISSDSLVQFSVNEKKSISHRQRALIALSAIAYASKPEELLLLLHHPRLSEDAGNALATVATPNLEEELLVNAQSDNAMTKHAAAHALFGLAKRHSSARIGKNLKLGSQETMMSWRILQ